MDMSRLGFYLRMGLIFFLLLANIFLYSWPMAMGKPLIVVKICVTTPFLANITKYKERFWRYQVCGEFSDEF